MPHDALFVVSTLGVGGSEKKIIRLTAELSRLGQTVGLAFLGGPETLLPTIDPAVSIWPLKRKGKFSPRALKALIDVIDRCRPKVVFAVDLYAALYVSIARRKLGIRLPTVSLVNTTTFVRRRDEVFMLMYAPILRSFDQVVFGSELQKDEWLRNYRLRSDTASVIHNGVDSDYFSRSAVNAGRSAGAASDAEIVIGNVARLAPEKNQRALIDVLPRLLATGIKASLLLVGGGPQREALEAQVKALGLAGKVQFAGASNDVRNELARMDIFVLCSRSVETFSNAALEAMSMSLPVVLSDIGGAREMVEHGAEGFIYPPLAEAQLFDCLKQLCEQPALRAAMGAAARNRVQHAFAIASMVAQYQQVGRAAVTAAASRAA